MLSRSSRRILSISAIIAISGFLFYKYRMYVLVLLMILIKAFIGIIDPTPEPADKQMIEHFRNNKKSFNRLICLWSFPEMDIDNMDKYHPLHRMSEEALAIRSFFENNTLYYFNLIPFRKENDDILLLARTDRESERDHLMENLKIRGGSRLDPYHITNSISFSYYYEGGPIKGFEYVYDRNVEKYDKKIFIETNKDLSDLIRSSGEYMLYKKIEDNWNLYITK